MTASLVIRMPDLHALIVVDPEGKLLAASYRDQAFVQSLDARLIESAKSLLMFTPDEFPQMFLRGLSYHVIIANIKNRAALIALLDLKMKFGLMSIDLHNFIIRELDPFFPEK